MEYKIDDQEAILLVKENNQDAQEMLLKKYKYIISIIIQKYRQMAQSLKIDYNDLYQEALIGFIEAIHNYQDDKEAGLPRFITICVERKIQNTIKKASTKKNKLVTDSLSLDQTYNSLSPLMDIISDNNINNPLVNLTQKENVEELTTRIKSILSKQEYEVYCLLINGINYQDIATLIEKSAKQVDNSIQRIRNKIKKMLDND